MNAAASQRVARTTFLINNLSVRVTLEQPNALQRGAYGGCETYSAWRPELVGPLVSFVQQTLRESSDRIRHVSVFENKASASLGVRAELQAHELAVAIDPTTLIVYDRHRVESYCISIVEKNDIWVRLDLFDAMEDHRPLARE